jgi:hypothetical protein
MFLHGLENSCCACDGWNQELLGILSVKMIWTGRVNDSLEGRVRGYCLVKS